MENITRSISHGIKQDHVFKVADSKTLDNMRQKLREMMNDNKSFLLDNKKPLCCIQVKRNKFYLSFGCYVKRMVCI